MSQRTRPPIADLLPLPEEVPIGRGKLPVRGLGLEEIGRLLSVYKDQFFLFMSGKGSFEHMALACPALLNDILCTAADVPEDDTEYRAGVARIPLGYQLDCMAAIWKLSVPDEKKLQSLLVLVAESLGLAKDALTKGQLMSSLAGNLQNGSTTSSEQATDPSTSQG